MERALERMWVSVLFLVFVSLEFIVCVGLPALIAFGILMWVRVAVSFVEQLHAST